MTAHPAVDSAFTGLALIAVAAAWRVFVTDSMVRAALFLLLSFLAVGALMLLLSAEYLGVAMFFMMAVEMLVMALFMVMFMMNPAGLNPMRMVHQHRYSVAAGVVAFLLPATGALVDRFPDRPAPEQLDPVVSLGTELLGESMLVFESVAVVLLATMIGAVVLTSHRGRFGPANEGSLPPGLEPGGRPAGMPGDAEPGDHCGHASHRQPGGPG